MPSTAQTTGDSVVKKVKVPDLKGLTWGSMGVADRKQVNKQVNKDISCGDKCCRKTEVCDTQ